MMGARIVLFFILAIFAIEVNCQEDEILATRSNNEICKVCDCSAAAVIDCINKSVTLHVGQLLGSDGRTSVDDDTARALLYRWAIATSGFGARISVINIINSRLEIIYNPSWWTTATNTYHTNANIGLVGSSITCN